MKEKKDNNKMKSSFNKKTNTLIMALADPSANPRPKRAIELCKSLGFDVNVIAFKPSKPEIGIKYHDLNSYKLNLLQVFMRKCLGLLVNITKSLKLYLLKSRFHYYYIYKVYKKLKIKHKLIIVENLELLPIAFDIKNEAKIIFDAREYYTRQYDNNDYFNKNTRPWRTRISLEYLKKCDAMTTVSKGLKREYKNEFGVKPVVFRSTPNCYDLQPEIIEPENIKIVYMGGSNIERQIEKLVDLVAFLDKRFYLDMYLVGNNEQLEFLKDKASLEDRIKIFPPVPFENIVTTLNKYDIGLAYFEPTSFNLANCLPNKYFEYIQARIAVATGPTPDMAELTKKYQCGIVSEEFTIESLADSLNRLTAEDIQNMKRNSDIAASELNFQKEQKIMISIINDLLIKSVASQG